MYQRAFMSLLASFVLLGSGACKQESKPPAEPTQTTGGITGTTAGESQFTSGDTFGVMRAIHTAEIDHGKLAQKKAKDPRVKAFAEKVVNDHKVRMQRDEQLMGGLGVMPRDNAVSESIKNSAAQQTERLDALSGSSFDRSYIEEQINYYRSVIDMFDRDLIPNVRDPQIKADLQNARARANDHLKEAQDIRASLSTMSP
jgi:putative membrane protein